MHFEETSNEYCSECLVYDTTHIIILLMYFGYDIYQHMYFEEISSLYCSKRLVYDNKHISIMLTYVVYDVSYVHSSWDFSYSTQSQRE